MYVCNVGIMFVCIRSSDQGRTVIPTVKSFIKLINQIKSLNSVPHEQESIISYYGFSPQW